MSLSKRIMDVTLALLLGIMLAVPAAVVALLILALDGRPVFYVSRRMKSPHQDFTLWKFRTMQPNSADNSVSGGYKSNRITRSGHILRRTRFDEIPQIFNILCGDMSFVGPRPPLPRFVASHPALYAKVLKSRPGITGLATLMYHETEERILARCRSQKEADQIYFAECIPAKAELDLLWAQNRTLWRDFLLLMRTVLHIGFCLPNQRRKFVQTKAFRN